MTRPLDLRWWLQRARPHYGLLTLWTLLMCAASLTGYFLTHRSVDVPCGQRGGPASVLSYLPDAFLLDRRVFYTVGLVFFPGAALWATQRLLPWSSWWTVVSFTTVMALWMENTNQVTHVAHATNLLLIVYALWYHFHAAEIDNARRTGRLLATPLYPRWTYELSVYCLGVFYGFSGLCKLLTSGPRWANGTSLQLWIRLWGDAQAPGVAWILAQRNLAATLQALTLLGETSGLLAIVCPRLRPPIGLLLIGFHIGAIAVFGWAFHANALLLALFFLPVPQWVHWFVTAGARASH